MNFRHQQGYVLSGSGQIPKLQWDPAAGWVLRHNSHAELPGQGGEVQQLSPSWCLCSLEHQNSGTAIPICSSPPSAAACRREEESCPHRGLGFSSALFITKLYLSRWQGRINGPTNHCCREKATFFVCHYFDLTVILTAQNHIRIFAGSRFLHYPPKSFGVALRSTLYMEHLSDIHS